MKRALIAVALPLVVAFGAARSVQAQRGHDQDQHGHEQDQHHTPSRVPQEEQQRRVRQQQQRSNEYREHLDQQVPEVQRQGAELQEQKRMAQYRAQQDYMARLQQQQQRLREERERDYSRDAYITTPHAYRYIVSGNARETNQYGADVLRQAVSYGYQQGYIAGRADRQDHWQANYENSIAYRDANYGYNGSYIDRGDYNYYFREGFRRGYDDGYYSRSRYGNSLNGTPTILGSLISTILGLQPIR